MRTNIWIIILVAHNVICINTQMQDITPEGKKLAEKLDQMNVEKLWLAGNLVEWETGKTIKATNDGLPHTHCSAFVAAVAASMDIYVLRPPEHKTVMLANAQCDWLKDAGKKQGWKEVGSAIEAQKLANRGSLVIAGYREPGNEISGHVAIVRPSEKSEKAILEEGPQIIQAGRKNATSTTVKAGFKSHPAAWNQGGIRYYVHEVKW